MRSEFKSILVIFAIVIALDIPANIFYFTRNTTFNEINESSDVSTIRQIISALIVYLLISAGIYFFIIKTKLSIYDTLIHSSVLGILIYGIYNSTTLFSINNYSIKTALTDTMWGTILITCTSILTKILIGDDSPFASLLH